jgi:fibronectin-binding autotransporter adhesin
MKSIADLMSRRTLSLLGRAGAPPRSRPRGRRPAGGEPMAEALESRMHLAALIWTGQGLNQGIVDPNWSNMANWMDSATGQSAVPAPGDSLSFPASAAQRASTNNLPADTSIASITIDGSNPYTITGASRLALGSGGLTVLGTAAHTFNVPVGLSNLGSSVTITLPASLSMIGPFTGAGPLNKGGDGRLDLAGDSPAFAGFVNVNAGILRVSTPQALGNTTGQTSVVNFATLLIAAGAGGSAEPVSIQGAGNSAQGAMHAEGAATWAGAVTVGAGATTIAVDAGDFTISGGVSRSAGAASLTKSGPGRLVLAGAVTLSTTDTTINAGALQLRGANPSLATTLVTSGAALELSGGITATVSSLSLSGSGSGSGALLNVAGNNTLNGPVSLAAATTIGSTAGTLTLRGNVDTGPANPGRTLTVAGAGGLTIGGTGTGAVSGSGGFTKTGTGTLTLSGTGISTYTGPVNAAVGALVAAKPSALGSTAAGTVVSNGASLQLSGGLTFDPEPLTINGPGIGGAGGALRNISGTNTWSGNITLGSPSTIGSAAGTVLIITGFIDTTAANFALQFGSAGDVQIPGTLTVPSGGVLQLSLGVTLTVNSLVLSGSGTGAGALINVTGANTLNGPVTLAASATIGSTAGTLTITGNIDTGSATPGQTLTVAGAGGVIVGGSGTGAVTGTGALSKTGTGTLTLSGAGANTYTGVTTITQGLLVAGKSSALGATGTGTTVASGAGLRLGVGTTYNAEPLTLSGAGVGGAGALSGSADGATWTGAVTLASAATIGSSTGTLSIPSDINTAAGAFTLTFAGAGDTEASGVISGAGDLAKNGAGTLFLSGANTYTGRTLVNAGIVQLLSSSALGSAAATSDTVVAAGATVQLARNAQGHDQSIAETLTLNGAGAGGIGALHNLKGGNHWTGPVTLASATSIGADAATFGPNVGLEISGVLSGSASLPEIGDAVIGLRGDNAAYTGRITVATGRLVVESDTALGSTAAASNTIVQAGATLDLAAALFGTYSSLTVAEPLTLSGTVLCSGIVIFGNPIGIGTLTGPLTLVGTLSIVTNAPLTISGVIGGTGGMRKTGTESLTLAAANTYSGNTDSNQGTLLVTGAVPGQVRVSVTNISASVGGTGTIGTLSIGPVGAIEPGVNGPGRLTVTGDLFIFGGAHLRVDLNGTTPGSGHDQIRVVTGDVTLTGNGLAVDATLGFSSAVGDVFRIIDKQSAGAISGGFSTATLTINSQTFALSTTGGTGNDGTLAHTNTGSAFGHRTITPVLDEGGTATLSGTIVDPDPLDTFFLEINWGDGGATQTHTFRPGTPRDITLTHLYTDDAPGGAPYTVSLLWRDQNSGHNTDALTVQVNNVAPTVAAGGDETLGPSRWLTRGATFTDPGLDTWAGTVDYGDGSPVEQLDLHHGGRFQLHHRYAGDGRYLVHVAVSDDDGGLGTAQFTAQVGDGEPLMMPPPPAPGAAWPEWSGQHPSTTRADSSRSDPFWPDGIDAAVVFDFLAHHR